MDSNLRIIFTGDGSASRPTGGGGGPASPSFGPVPSSGPAAGPSGAAGRRRRPSAGDGEDDPGDAQDGLGSAIRAAGSVAAGAVGLGAYAAGVARVVTALNDLYEAIMRVVDATPQSTTRGREVEQEVLPSTWDVQKEEAERRGFRPHVFGPRVDPPGRDFDTVYQKIGNDSTPIDAEMPGATVPRLGWSGRGPIGSPAASGVIDGTATPAAGNGEMIVAGGGTTVETAGVTSAAVEGPAASAAMSLGTVAVALAGVAAAAVAAVVAIRASISALSDEVEKSSAFSPDVANATAEREVMQMENQIERSNLLGADLARFADVQTEAQNQLYELGTQVLGVLLEFFKVAEPFIVNGLQFTDIIVKEMEVVRTSLATLVDVATFQWGDVPQDLKNIWDANSKMGKAIIDWVTAQKDKDKFEFDDKFFKEFTDSIETARRRIPGGGGPPPPRPPAPPPPPPGAL